MLTPLQAPPFAQCCFSDNCWSCVLFLGIELSSLGHNRHSSVCFPTPPALPGTFLSGASISVPCSPHLDPAVCTGMCFAEAGFVEGVQGEGGLATGRNQPWGPLTAHASQGSKASPGLMPHVFNQATLFALKVSSKSNLLSHANRFTCFKR